MTAAGGHPLPARSYKRSTPSGRWDAIVIGSGIGGLATASLLARHGDQRVLVLERHYTPGGYTHVFKRRGYEWDVGVHYVGELETGSGLEAVIDAVTGGTVRWARMPECYDRVFLGERSFDLVAGREAYVDELARSFPHERATLRWHLEMVDRATRAAAPMLVDRGLPPRLARALGPLLRRPVHRYSDRTVEQTLRPRIRDPLLFDVLTAQFGDYGLTPRRASFLIHAMVVSHFIDGGYYPVGGPATLAEGAIGVIEAGGGEVYTRAEVGSILMEGGRAVGVRMADGEVIRAPIVVSDAGAPLTYMRLLPPEVAARTGMADRLRGVGPSSAHLCLHLGFRQDDAELGLDGTNLWIYPEGDRDAAFARFAEDPLHAPLPLAFVSFPSAKDPSFSTRHPGKATVEVITLAEMDWFRRWAGTRWMKRGEGYQRLKERLSERLLEVLFAHRPQLEGRVDHAELSTPLTTEHFTGHPSGEMYGLAHTPERFRLPLSAQTRVPGLFLTGADLAACGVGGALIGGAVCAAAVLRHRLGSVLRRRVFGGLPQAGAPEPAPAWQARLG